MPMTFEDCYRRVRLEASAAPTLLCRSWVDEAWKELAGERSWSFLRGETILRFRPPRSVVVTVTDGSATVTSSGGFAAADVGRGFRVDYGITFTIIAVVDANTITLDRAWAEADATPTATISDPYVTLPADFGAFRLIPDRYNQRQIAFWLTEDQVHILDPRKAFSDTNVRMLFPAAASPVPATAGQIRYEAWPRPAADRSYPALYTKQAASLIHGTTFTGVLADGGDVLIRGALAKACSWPGTIDQRNPLFNLALAETHRKEFRAGVQRLSLKDDAQYPDDSLTVQWARWPIASLAYNDHALRASDAGSGGYF